MPVRYQILPRLFTRNETNFYDLLAVQWSSFNFSQGFKVHTVTAVEIEKPYLISYAEFNDTKYEDLIFLINGIADPHAMIPGQKLKIPYPEDIKRFFAANKNKSANLDVS